MKFSVSRTAALLTVCAGLSACAQSDQWRWPWEQQPQSPRTAAQRVPDRIAAPESRPARAAPVQRQVRVPEKRPTPPTAAERDAPPAPQLVGLSESETAELLGRPAEENEQAPGKVWIYKAAGCQLAVHLFPDMQKGGFYTLDYTVEDGPRDACLGKVAGEARKKG
ncbi:MAG: hypothetical protein ACM33T_15700 [Solirubrobacterales bacterium]